MESTNWEATEGDYNPVFDHAEDGIEDQWALTGNPTARTLLVSASEEESSIDVPHNPLLPASKELAVARAARVAWAEFDDLDSVVEPEDCLIQLKKLYFALRKIFQRNCVMRDFTKEEAMTLMRLANIDIYSRLERRSAQALSSVLHYALAGSTSYRLNVLMDWAQECAIKHIPNSAFQRTSTQAQHQ
jgi:hypothetical protein